MLNRYGESGQPCLVPDFSVVASSFSPFTVIFATGLLSIAFIMLRYGTQIPDLSKTFIMKGCWTISIVFPASKEIILFFPLSLFI